MSTTTTTGPVIVVMGVSGCGKSTVAVHLGQELDLFVRDGDELHPASNIEKMSSGIPLTDDDREPWLNTLRDYAAACVVEHGGCVIACSALKQRYRDLLNEAGSVFYVFLNGSRELIASRMHLRTGHFMPENLLDSQFSALEDPRGEPNVITVDIDASPQEVARQAAGLLRARVDFASTFSHTP